MRTRFWRRRDQIRQERAAFSGSYFRVEQLEPRYLLTVAPFGYDTVSADWFETVAESSPSAELSVGSPATDWIGAFTDGSGSTSSDTNGWIVRLSPSALQTVSRVTDAVGLFSSAPGLRVLGGLGLPGQLLLESTACSSEIFSYLAGQGFVSSFEPDLPISVSSSSTLLTSNDPRYGDLYGLHNTGQSGGTTDADIDAPEAWQVSTGSRDLIVGVIDTGIDYTHPDLAANMWVNPGEIAGNGIDDDANGFVDDVHGYDFANDDGDPFDDNGHGTHCAGTIGGVGNNGVGVVGVNWEVSLMGLKFLDANGSGSTSDAIQAVNYATMMKNQYGQNVRVTSNSWGGGGSSSAMRQAIESGAEAEIVFIAAAGNDGMNNDTNPQYPASYTSDAVISVAATDRNDALANFSNYGATGVDIAAPGVGIVSTTPGNSYASFSGTSMATPHVAGAVALALAVDPTLTVSQLRSGLLGTVDAVAGLVGKTVTGGRLNVGRLVESLSSEPTVPLPPSGLNASDGSTLGSVRVSWGSSLSAESYTLWRNGTDDASTATIIADSLSTTSYQDVAADVNETYYYWASATNELGTSPLSNSDSGFYSPSRSPNDAFVDRTLLVGYESTASGTNLDATEESGEPTHHGVGGGKSVWWTWTAPASGNVEINTVGSGFDTVLAIYEGSRVDDLTRLASNDDIDYGRVLQSRLTLSVTAGQSYQIAVDGYDGDAGSLAVALTLDAAVAPEPITDISLSSLQVNENLPAGALVGVLEAAGGGDVRYSLVTGNVPNDNEKFSIRGNALKTRTQFDYESDNSYTIRVRAVSGEDSFEKTFVIFIADANDAPTIIRLSEVLVPETALPRSFVGEFTVLDEDIEDTHVLSLIAGEGSDGNTLFAIDGTSLVTTGQFDFETVEAHSIRVRATDAAGDSVDQVFTIEITDVSEGLLVEQVTPDRDGFQIRFTGQLDVSNLDLHNRVAAPENLDVTLRDSAGNLIESAIAIDDSQHGFRLVVNNGIMSAGDYTLVIRSGEDGIVAADGRLLDGNGDGLVGDDFMSTFTIQPLPAGTAIVGVPGFFETAGQEVNVPASSAGGIPIVVTASEGVMSLDMELFYNPELLDISGIELAEGMPSDALSLINVLEPGRAVVGFFSPQPLGAGSYEVARLLATVPTTAEKDQTHVLDVRGASLNEGLISTFDDDGIHVVAVGNRAPTDIRLTSSSVVENSPSGTVVGTLDAIDPDYGDTFTFELVAGEGDVNNASFAIAGSQLITTTNLDFEAGATRSIRVRVTDGDGESFELTTDIQVLNQVETLYVTALESVLDGFRMSFSQQINMDVVNLYDAMSIHGEADLNIRGAATGDVRGSVVIAADGTSLQFVADSPLAMDTYFIVARSGAHAFQTVTGEWLDGNSDEVAGDDYNGSFTVLETPAIRLEIPSFARGAGQDVNVPAASNAGIPLVLESDGTVRSLYAIFSYDSKLLNVQDVVPSSELPSFVTLTTEFLEAGRIAVMFDATGSFPDGEGAPAGRLVIANVQSQVSATAGNGSLAILSLESVISNGTLSVGGGSAVQLVAALGDTTGDGSFSVADSTLAARLAMRLDSGLVNYPLVNPSLVADVTGNGTVSMLDAAMIAGVSGVDQGPSTDSASPPRQMLLRHEGSFRRADVINTSGVLSEEESKTLSEARNSAASRAQAFADIAAGWAASRTMNEGAGFTLTGDSDETNKSIFVDPGLV
ncbi:MAG: S8 family serine peptidase [Planctomycetaceae bacterium]|nr:S8 family serine peptidase [Planctomycetaceae bacterium]